MPAGFRGAPLWFGAARKAYVSFHLVPLYMSAPPQGQISPSLKKRMQGKPCFNFNTIPDAELLTDLRTLTAAATVEVGWHGKGLAGLRGINEPGV